MGVCGPSMDHLLVSVIKIMFFYHIEMSRLLVVTPHGSMGSGA